MAKSIIPNGETKSKSSARTKRDKGEAIDKIYKSVLACKSAIPPDEMEALADLVMNQTRVGRQWRLTAVLASKDGAFFKEVSEDADKAETLAPVVDLLLDFSKLMKVMSDLAKCVSMRIAVAGCNHEHFNTWAKEVAE